MNYEFRDGGSPVLQYLYILQHFYENFNYKIFLMFICLLPFVILN